MKLKNAIMQNWSKIKSEKSTGSLKDMIDQMLSRKKDADGGGQDYAARAEAEAELKNKMEKRKERQ